MTKSHLRLVAGKDLAERKAKRPAAASAQIVFETVGRQKLRAAVWKGQGGGRPLLFFNAIGMNLELAAPLAAALGDRDVITFDMPGIGLSPAPQFPYRPWWAAHAAAKILDRYGYTGKVDVMGVSWGGLAAQQFAFQSAHRVNRVILAATSPGTPMVPGHLGVWGRLLNPRSLFDPDTLERSLTGLLADPDGPSAKLAAKFRVPTPTGYAAQLAAMTGWSSLPFLPFLTMPALIVMGDSDSVVPPVNGRILNALMPNSRLHIVKGAGHVFPITLARQTAPVLRTFLDEDRLDRMRETAGRPLLIR